MAHRISGWFFVICGAAIVIALRVHGINLTEGQLLIMYWPLWLAAIALLLGGATTLHHTKDN